MHVYYWRPLEIIECVGSVFSSTYLLGEIIKSSSIFPESLIFFLHYRLYLLEFLVVELQGSDSITFVQYLLAIVELLPDEQYDDLD
jgi:hypothetical protein